MVTLSFINHIIVCPHRCHIDKTRMATLWCSHWSPTANLSFPFLLFLFFLSVWPVMVRLLPTCKGALWFWSAYPGSKWPHAAAGVSPKGLWLLGPGVSSGGRTWKDPQGCGELNACLGVLLSNMVCDIKHLLDWSSFVLSSHHKRETYTHTALRSC